jgi:hypothetical protein
MVNDSRNPETSSQFYIKASIFVHRPLKMKVPFKNFCKSSNPTSLKPWQIDNKKQLETPQRGQDIVHRHVQRETPVCLRALLYPRDIMHQPPLARGGDEPSPEAGTTAAPVIREEEEEARGLQGQCA